MVGRKGALVFAWALLPVASGCADDSPQAPAGPASTGDIADPVGIACAPGTEVGCMCNDGTAGTQLCAASGLELGPCVCAQPSGEDDDDDDDDETGDTSTGTAGDTEDGEETQGAEAICGDGEVQGDEQCDDANGIYDDECNNECIAQCGPMWRVALGDLAGSSRGLDIAVSEGFDVAVTGAVDAGDHTDIFIGLFDAEGNERWTIAEGGDEDDSGEAVAVDESRVLVVGTERGPANAGIWVRAYDHEATQLWWDVINGPDDGDDFGTGAAIDADGNAFVVGTMSYAPQDTDVRVMKYDAKGELLWSQVYGGQGHETSLDRAGQAVADESGNVWVLAEVDVAQDERDVHLLRFRPDGKDPQVDYAPFAGSGADLHLAGELAVTPDGGAVFTVNREDSAPGWFFWVVKVDADGDEEWVVSADDLGVGNRHLAEGLGVDEDGNVVVIGTRALAGENPEPYHLSLSSDGMSIACNGITQTDAEFARTYGGTVDRVGNIYPVGDEIGDGGSRPWLARARQSADNPQE